jgi:hypothetical protein
MAEPGQFWRNYFANREFQRKMAQQGIGRFGAAPPSGGAVMGGGASVGGELVPITKEGIRVGAGTVESQAPKLVRAATLNGPAMVTKGVTPGMELVPVGARAAAAGAAETGAARQGLLAAARGQLGTVGRGIAANGWKGGLMPAAVGMAGTMAGGALDESQLLGGSESKANDTAAKALKWGGTGAGLGLMVGGPVGALIGGAAGGVVGVMHEGLERQGILGTASKQSQANTLINETNAAAAEIGLPAEVTQLLDAQYNAGLQFAKTDDEKLALAQQYAAQVQEQALAYAANPEAFAPAGGSAEDELANMLIQRSVMMSAVKPYADNFLAQANAQADMYQNMAAGAGDMAPAFEQMAAQTRASGARNAMGVVAETQMTPYQMALEKQAGYLNQMSNSLVSQAMGQVMQPQAAAGSVDLTALIDGAANQMQPQ